MFAKNSSAKRINILTGSEDKYVRQKVIGKTDK